MIDVDTISQWKFIMKILQFAFLKKMRNHFLQKKSERRLFFLIFSCNQKFDLIQLSGIKEKPNCSGYLN
jgi:hypothetical protein